MENKNLSIEAQEVKVLFLFILGYQNLDIAKRESVLPRDVFYETINSLLAKRFLKKEKKEYEKEGYNYKPTETGFAIYSAWRIQESFIEYDCRDAKKLSLISSEFRILLLFTIGYSAIYLLREESGLLEPEFSKVFTSLLEKGFVKKEIKKDGGVDYEITPLGLAVNNVWLISECIQ
ncbi:hypothetical protein CSB11_00025 [Candidatus Campbellbacteria bacterium]|nr:MAG: hypothetical protein CSB11_00025 [Candidatus Campbellbacteria bacterium]